MMNALLSKISSVFILAVTTTVAGLLPLKVRKTPVKRSDDQLNTGHKHGLSERVMNAVLAFSGGVLFSTIFIHLMPDVDADFEKALAKTKSGLVSLSNEEPSESIELPIVLTVKMPWGQLAICVGFFVIYALEEVVEYFICRACEKQHHHHNDGHSSGHDVAHHHGINETSSLSSSDVSTSSVKYKTPDKKPPNSCISPVHGTHGAHREPHQVRDCTEVRRIHEQSLDDVDLETNNEKTPLFQIAENALCYNSTPNLLKHERSACSDDTCKIFIQQSIDHQHHHDDHEHDHGHSHEIRASSELDKFQDIRNTMRGLMLIVALSFHSVFEGMAIGLQSSTSGIWTSFAAVAFHKLIMAFCAGVELVTLHTKRCVYIWSMVTFALVCPIGIAIGTIITEAIDSGSTDSSPSLFIASLQGLACGTLLYVTFFEVLTRTKGNEMASVVNFICVLFGFGVITGLHLVD